MNAYEEEQYKEIQAWRKSSPSFFGKSIEAVDKVFTYAFMPLKLISIPVSKVLTRVVPTSAMEGAIKGACRMGGWCVNEGDIIKKGRVSSIDELKTKDLKTSDEIANNIHNRAIAIGGTEGAVTGVGGYLLIGADIVALTTLSFRIIHQIGLCYGVRLKGDEGVQIALGILSIVMSESKQEKAETIKLMDELMVNALEDIVEEVVEDQICKNIMGKRIFGRFIGGRGVFFTIKGVAQNFGIRLGRRKLMQLTPIIGAGIGGALNSIHLNNVAWTARRIFQERWLRDNQKIEVNEDTHK